MKAADILIIGAGQGAPVVFEAAEKAGKRCLIAESGEVGGSCVNFGCTPTKAAIASTNLLALIRRSGEFGLRSDVEPDFEKILSEARGFSERSRHSLEKYYGRDLIRGVARFVGRKGDGYVVRCGEEEVHAAQVVIGTGTGSVTPRIEGLDPAACIYPENWHRRTELPKSMAIVGAGYIAMEMGQFYQRLGCQMSVIDRSACPLGTEDEEVSGFVRETLAKEGVEFVLSTTFERAERTPEGWRLSCSCPEGPRELVAQKIFIAAGRRGNTDNLGLDTVGIVPDPKTGYLSVDEHLRTSAPGIFAMGDVRGGGLFTSTAWDDGRIVSDLLFGDGRRTTDRLVPYAVFTDPEVGRVGLSERQARESGMKFRIAKFDLAHSGAALEHRAARGFVKLVIEEGTNQILGAAVATAGASDLIMLFSLMMQVRAPVTVLRDMVVVHPTFAEALQSAVLD